MARWQSWHAAFEEAAKHVGAAPTQYAHRMTVSPDDFAAALSDLMGFSLTERGQAACRDGLLEWYDARGRCVLLEREGSRAGEQALPVATEADVMAAIRRANAPLTTERPKALDGLTNAEVREALGPALTPSFALEGTPEARALEEAQFNRRAADLIKGAEDRAIVAEQAKIDAKPKGKKK